MSKCFCSSFQALHALSKMKITSHPSTIRDKLLELGQDHDDEVFKWKDSAEKILSECSLVDDLSKHFDNDVGGADKLQQILGKVLGVTSKI